MQIFYTLLFMLNEMSPYILLGFLIASVLHSFVPRPAMARHLSGTGWKSVAKAALFGIPLPLCSCGVLPTAVALRRGGASRAASTSFLVATPQTGVDSIAATWSLLGPAFAVVRPFAALVTALFAGIAVGRGEKSSEETSCSIGVSGDPDSEREPFGARCISALRYGFVDLVSSIGSWLVAGLVIAALITIYVPDDFFASLGSHPLLAMVAVVVVAVPMYVCATGSIPIALSLVLKGLSPGTALVFLMAGPAANFASFTIISREMGRKAAATYLGAIVLGSMAFGLAIDYLMPSSWFSLSVAGMSEGCHHAGFPLFPTSCSVILVGLLIYSFIHGRKHNHFETTDMTQEFIIKGMNCPHCRASVVKAISEVDGVEAVDVDLSTGRAIVQGAPVHASIVSAVRAAGFDVDE